MQILYAIALLSFIALAWAAVAIARHIRKNAATQHEQDREALSAVNLRSKTDSRTLQAQGSSGEPGRSDEALSPQTHPRPKSLSSRDPERAS
jgi:hypothetical protein